MPEVKMAMIPFKRKGRKGEARRRKENNSPESCERSTGTLFTVNKTIVKSLKVIIGLLLIQGCIVFDAGMRGDAWQTGKDWPVYGGNKAGNRYSPLRQVNLKNVSKLEVAWMYN